MGRGRDGVPGSPGRGIADAARCRKLVRRIAGLTLACALLVAGGQGGAGRQVGHDPSYYPDEITIATLDAAAAAKGLGEETLHAYVGAAPSFSGPAPAHVKAARSLGSFRLPSRPPATGNSQSMSTPSNRPG